MTKSDVEILICEDDKSLGPAMATALERSGYKVTLVSTVTQAFIQLKSGSFLCYIIDCMLPDQNGVNLAKGIRIGFGSTPQIIMMSGILKEKDFIRQTVKSVGAQIYLIKPFNIEDLIQAVNECLRGRTCQPVELLQTFINRPANSHLNMIKNNELHGFELPIFLAAAIEGCFCGFLELNSEELEIRGKIHFHRGHIFAVESNDQESLLGRLLAEKGFITMDEVESNFKEGTKKRIGEHLVEINSVSPHSIHATMIEQMTRRISKMIQDTTYLATLVEEENLPSDVSIGSEAFYLFLNDWIKTRLTNQWLESHLSSLTNYFISDIQPLVQHDSVSSLVSAELKTLSQTEAPFLQLLERAKNYEEKTYPEIYFMILSRRIKLDLLGTKKYGLQIKRLKELIALYENQNHYERLELDRFATMDDVHNSYSKRCQMLDYKNAPSDCPEELFEFSRQVLFYLEESYRVLSNADLRTNYTVSLIDSSSSFLSESDMNFGYQALIAGNYQKASDIFQRMPQSSYEQWAIYSIWAKIKCQKKPSEAFVKQVYREVLQIPIPYDPKRHAHYHVVKGLCCMLRKEYTLAKNCFEHAIGIDSSIPAIKRELRKANSLIGEQETHSVSRITTLLSSLLKKKVS